MSWFLNAENNLLAAGVGPLTGRQQAFGYIKAMENTIAAILIAVFVLRRDRVGTSLVLLAALIVPIGDVIAILRVGVPPEDVPLYAPVVAAIILSSAIELFSESTRSDGQSERIVVPRTVGKRIVLLVAGFLIAAIAVGFTTRWMVDPGGLSSEWGLG